MQFYSSLHIFYIINKSIDYTIICMLVTQKVFYKISQSYQIFKKLWWKMVLKMIVVFNSVIFVGLRAG
jgi:hypothetical protein